MKYLLLLCHQVVTGQGGVDIGGVLAGVELPPPELGGVVPRRGGVLAPELLAVAVVKHPAASFLLRMLEHEAVMQCIAMLPACS